MPLYEYRCESCAAQEEKLEGFSAPTEHACPKCGAATGMHRQLSVSAFNLAGGGWHSQGYTTPAPGKADGKADGKDAAAPAAAATPAPASGCAGGCACHTSKPAN